MPKLIFKFSTLFLGKRKKKKKDSCSKDDLKEAAQLNESFDSGSVNGEAEEKDENPWQKVVKKHRKSPKTLRNVTFTFAN